jgi:nucleoside 2-deoxyribosyltransferase
MGEAFTIMQIGNVDLDKVYTHAIVPALKAFDLDPKRVDKHNEGRLLKSEIVRFIGLAEIIIADLTNERPNCYLEVGYAMGQGKFRNLILTAREDHYHESPN